MRAVLVGNYGVGNFGDEALKEYFLGAFPDAQWTVVSARPERGEMPRLPAGIRSLLGTPWWRTIGAIGRSDAVVFGGGTLFTDIESVQACFLWGLHAFFAWLCRKKIVLAFQGIGPFKTALGEGIARWVVRRASHLSVRDEASAARIASWKMNTKVIHTFDPVFLLFLSKKREHRAQNVYVLIPRHTSGAAFRTTLENHATNLRHTEVVIALFQPDDRRERKVIEMLRVQYPQASVRTIRTADDLMELLATASHCICERFHGALAAVAAGVPLTVVSQAAGDKLEAVASLAQSREIERATGLAETGESALRAALND